MSDWNRSRDNDQRRYGADERNRREFGAGDPWPDRNRAEPRSFDDRSQGGSGRADDRTREDGRRAFGEGGGSGGYGYAAGQDYGRQEFGRQDYARQDYGRQGYGEDRQRQYGEQSYGRSFGPSNQPYGRQGAQGYRGEWAQTGYGQGGGAFGNEPLQRVTDGEYDHGFRTGGEHRGRGPKNYTRSDERIREDVNDRLSDDAWLDATEIEIQVAAGEVTLTGAVNSREDKRRAEDIAEQVSGVKHVQNNLRVQQPGQSMASQAGDSRSTSGAAGATTGRNTSGTQI